jgi:hypothetical protein
MKRWGSIQGHVAVILIRLTIAAGAPIPQFLRRKAARDRLLQENQPNSDANGNHYPVAVCRLHGGRKTLPGFIHWARR